MFCLIKKPFFLLPPPYGEGVGTTKPAVVAAMVFARRKQKLFFAPQKIASGIKRYRLRRIVLFFFRHTKYTFSPFSNKEYTANPLEK